MALSMNRYAPTTCHSTVLEFVLYDLIYPSHIAGKNIPMPTCFFREKHLYAIIVRINDDFALINRATCSLYILGFQ